MWGGDRDDVEWVVDHVQFKWYVFGKYLNGYLAIKCGQRTVMVVSDVDENRPIIMSQKGFSF